MTYNYKRRDRNGQFDGVTACLVADDGEIALYHAKWDERGNAVVAKNVATTSSHFHERYAV